MLSKDLRKNDNSKITVKDVDDYIYKIVMNPDSFFHTINSTHKFFAKNWKLDSNYISLAIYSHSLY